MKAKPKKVMLNLTSSEMQEAANYAIEKGFILRPQWRRWVNGQPIYTHKANRYMINYALKRGFKLDKYPNFSLKGIKTGISFNYK